MCFGCQTKSKPIGFCAQTEKRVHILFDLRYDGKKGASIPILRNLIPLPLRELPPPAPYPLDLAGSDKLHGCWMLEAAGVWMRFIREQAHAFGFSALTEVALRV